MTVNIFIASARSGSSRLGQIIAELGIHFIPEPFHPNCGNWGFCGSYQSIAQEVLGIYDHALTPGYLREEASVLKLCAYLHKSPIEFIVEIFPEHLAIDVIGQLVSLYPVIILQRRLIDQYISLQKAYVTSQAGKWTGIDTTNFKINLCAHAFYKYISSMRDFYLHVASSIAPRNSLASLIVDYEYFSCFSDVTQVRLVSTLLEQVGFSVSPLIKAADSAAELHRIAFPDKLNRQDHSPGWYQKVANPREFVLDLERLLRLDSNVLPHSSGVGMRALSVLDIANLPFSILSTSCA